MRSNNCDGLLCRVAISRSFDRVSNPVECHPTSLERAYPLSHQGTLLVRLNEVCQSLPVVIRPSRQRRHPSSANHSYSHIRVAIRALSPCSATNLPPGPPLYGAVRFSSLYHRPFSSCLNFSLNILRVVYVYRLKKHFIACFLHNKRLSSCIFPGISLHRCVPTCAIHTIRYDPMLVRANIVSRIILR